ncbi:ABC transporter substrate-binding protein [Anaerotignum sp.]|uniref:ABC transporter substrate-binding protein n=1 Tax=Anaerotignum sp. TaxID=2039241 RepID=UPI0027154D31|nr:ABC transporter substrate-binding protein [Anaerotignum sp.]
MKKNLMVLILLCVLILSGCSEGVGNDNKFSVSGDVEKSQEETHVLTLSMRVPETLNPLRNREETVDTILKLIFQPLIAFDGADKPCPSVAESWSFSEDGLTLSLQLRSDITWQNGSPLTADDVAFSIDTIQGATEDSVYKKVMDYVSTYHKTGQYSIDISFRTPFSKNLAALEFPIISKAYYQGQSDPKSEVNLSPMGSGPYAMKSYSVASEMILTANPSYAGQKPAIDTVSVRTTGGAETDVYAFNQGMTDILVTDAVDTGRYADEGGADVYQFVSGQYDFIGFNFHRSLFQDKNMRQAVDYALPKKAIYDNVYLQYAQLTNTPVSPSSWLYEENVAPFEYDGDMAATLLKNAGWIDKNGDGRLEKDGENGEEQLHVTILANQENGARKQIATKLRDELTLLGFDVSLDLQPFDQYQEKFLNGDFDLIVGGWQISPVTNLYDFFGSGGSMNYIGYEDEQMDALLLAANQAVGEGETLLAYSSLQKRIAEELPYISIAFRKKAMLTSVRVGGEIVPTEEDIFYSISQWTFDSDKE